MRYENLRFERDSKDQVSVWVPLKQNRTIISSLVEEDIEEHFGLSLKIHTFCVFQDEAVFTYKVRT